MEKKGRFGSGFFGWLTGDKAVRQDKIAAAQSAQVVDDEAGTVAAEEEVEVAGGEVAVVERRRKSALVPRKAQDEVLDLIRSMRKHMDDQSQRSDRIFELLEGLPAVIKSIPATNEGNIRMLEAIQSHMQQQAQLSDRFSEVVSDLARATTDHDRALVAIHEQQKASGHELVNSFGMVNAALGQVGQAQEASTAVLQSIVERSEASEARAQALFGRASRQMATFSAVSSLMAIAAICLAGYLAYTFTQSSQSPASQPMRLAEVTPPAEVAPEAAAPVAAPAAVPAAPAPTTVAHAAAGDEVAASVVTVAATAEAASAGDAAEAVVADGAAVSSEAVKAMAAAVGRAISDLELPALEEAVSALEAGMIPAFGAASEATVAVGEAAPISPASPAAEANPLAAELVPDAMLEHPMLMGPGLDPMNLPHPSLFAGAPAKDGAVAGDEMRPLPAMGRLE